MTFSRARSQIKIVDFKYKWTISNFSFCCKESGKMIMSPTFATSETDIGGCLHLYPGGVNDKYKNYVTVYLHPTGKENYNIMAMFTLNIVSKDGTKDIFRKSELGNFSDYALGFEKFVERSFLMNADNGLLEDDELTIECRIKINTDVINHPYDISETDAGNNAGSEDYFGEIWKEKLFTDVLLIVENEKFAAHRAILAVKSKVFKQIFTESPDESKFYINDISIRMMEDVLNFLYSGKLDVAGLAAKDSLSIAESYKFLNTELQTMCEAKMFNNINPKNAAKLLIFAQDNMLNKLKPKIVDFIQKK